MVRLSRPCIFQNCASFMHKPAQFWKKSCFIFSSVEKVYIQSYRYIYYNTRIHWFKKNLPNIVSIFFYLLTMVLGPWPARLCCFNRLCDVFGNVLMYFLVLLSIIYIICWSIPLGFCYHQKPRIYIDNFVSMDPVSDIYEYFSFIFKTTSYWFGYS